MLQARIGRMLVIGLSEDSIRRLRDGKFLGVPFRSFGLEVDGMVTIAWGETENDIEKKFRRLGIPEDIAFLIVNDSDISGEPPAAPF